ncbi:MAG: FAD:protein FMN transferase [Bacteroidales bacterium]
MYSIISLFIVIAWFSMSCNDPQPENIQLSGETQGTYYFISYYDEQGRNFKSEVDSLLDGYMQSVSVYQEHSVISRFNRNEEDLVQDDIFRKNIKMALEIAEVSGGAFDPTVAPLVDAWGFGADERENTDSLYIDSLRRWVGYESLEFSGGKLRKKHPETQVNFNAIAKGYAVDLVSEFLADNDIENYLVDIGGEVKTGGRKPGGKKWSVGIEKPAENKMSERTVEVVIEPENLAVATSGSYRRYYEKEGNIYSHTINPRTGRPVEHNLLSVSVVTESCAAADAWATAFMVMGTDSTIEFIEHNPQLDLQVFLIYADEERKFQTVQSDGFEQYLRK